MGCSVAEAQQRVSSREFAEWRAYDLRDPIGPDRLDLMLAIVATTVANSTGRMKRPLKPADFLPKFGPPKRQSPEHILAAFRRAGRMSAQVAKQKQEQQQARTERQQSKQTKDPRTKPTDHGQRGHRKRQVRSTDRRL